MAYHEDPLKFLRETLPPNEYAEMTHAFRCAKQEAEAKNDSPLVVFGTHAISAVVIYAAFSLMTYLNKDAPRLVLPRDGSMNAVGK